MEDRWARGLSDVNVPKGVDEEGWTTMAKYAAQSLQSGRELCHKRGIEKSDAIESDTQQLKVVASGILN